MMEIKLQCSEGTINIMISSTSCTSLASYWYITGRDMRGMEGIREKMAGV